MFILCLDIDDCIFPSDNTYFGRTDDSLEVLKLNLKRIKMIFEKYDIKVFITSSWSIILKLEGLNILYKPAVAYELDDNFYKHEYEAFKMISETINGRVVGLSKGDRYEDIKTLLSEGFKIIALDDMDLSFRNLNFDVSFEKNYLYVETNGFITNDLTYRINSFINKFKHD